MDKDGFGTGDWLCGQTEHCLLAVRGTPIILASNQGTVLQAARREHSRKPDEFFGLVERVCPGAKVELFSRTERVAPTKTLMNDCKRNRPVCSLDQLRKLTDLYEVSDDVTKAQLLQVAEVWGSGSYNFEWRSRRNLATGSESATYVYPTHLRF